MMKNTKNEDIKTVMRIKKVKILSINKHNKKNGKLQCKKKIICSGMSLSHKNHSYTIQRKIKMILGLKARLNFQPSVITRGHNVFCENDHHCDLDLRFKIITND
jgi:hypothetical protein